LKRAARVFVSFLGAAAIFSGCTAPGGTLSDIPIDSTPSAGSNASLPSIQKITPLPTKTPSPAPTSRPTSTPTPTPTPSASGKPIALVYGGPGVLTGPGDTLEMAKTVAAQAGFTVIEVTHTLDTATLNSASVWIQPGGPNLSADSYMNGNGMADQVRDFVTRGGGYVGFCGGAFSAVNNLGLIQGSAWNLNQATGKIPVTWLGKVRYIHFEHGPYITLTDKNVEVVGTYADGSVAVARTHYGKGEVFISGVHPEAGSFWPPTYDPDGSDQYLAVGMIQEVAARPSP
jgi:glutamine amidotransferase-like uncharacterized protein